MSNSSVVTTVVNGLNQSNSTVSQLSNSLVHNFTNPFNGPLFGSFGLHYSQDQKLHSFETFKSVYNHQHVVHFLRFHLDADFLIHYHILDNKYQADLYLHVDHNQLDKAIEYMMDQLIHQMHYRKPIWIGQLQLLSSFSDIEVVVAIAETMPRPLIQSFQLPMFVIQQLSINYQHFIELGGNVHKN